MAQLCPCTKRHSPRITLAETELHHSPPKSYSLVLGAQREVVRLCKNAHELEHGILNLFRAHDPDEPPARDLRRFPPVLVDLARRAWAATDRSMPVPRTVASVTDHEEPGMSDFDSHPETRAPLGATTYTHQVCGTCGTVLFCSEAEPWSPPSGFGWCWHSATPEPVSLRLMTDNDRHNCPPKEAPCAD